MPLHYINHTSVAIAVATCTYECGASYVTNNVESEDQLKVLHLIFGVVNIRKHIFDAKTLIHMFPVSRSTKLCSYDRFECQK